MVSEVSRYSLGFIFNFYDAFCRLLVCHQKLNIKKFNAEEIVELKIVELKIIDLKIVELKIIELKIIELKIIELNVIELKIIELKLQDLKDKRPFTFETALSCFDSRLGQVIYPISKSSRQAIVSNQRLIHRIPAALSKVHHQPGPTDELKTEWNITATTPYKFAECRRTTDKFYV